MRTLIITGTFPTKHRPSAGVFVRNQFQMLRRRAAAGEKLELFCVYTRWPSQKRSILKIFLAALRFVPYLLRRYDVLHIHFLSPLIFAALLYRRMHPDARIVVTVHGSGLRRIEKSPPRVARRYARALAKVDHVIAAGPALAGTVKKLLGREVSQVLCAGVDEVHFFREDVEGKEYDFIFVGALDQCKGFDTLLDALEHISDLGVRICCVGSGSLGSRAKGMGQSMYIDLYRDVPQRRLRHLFNRSRFLVYPSRAQGFGLVVSEAMHCGTPGIVFAESGAQSQVRHNENGLIYKPNTADKLARVLRDAFTLEGDSYEALSTGAENANRDHALEVVCEAHLQLYRRLAAGNAVTARAGKAPHG